MSVSVTQAALARAFDEWKRRHETDPNSFRAIADSEYGESCAKYLMELLAVK